MEIIKIEDWDHFIKKITDEFKYWKGLNKRSEFYVSPCLFRGQSNDNWELLTSLDRFERSMKVFKYLEIICGIKSAVESLTLHRWEELNIEKEIKMIDDKDHFSMQCYQYLTHLRHHGFPSPLLDWSMSPYIAAFFAVNDLNKSDGAIFSYIETPQGSKEWSSNEPKILCMGPNIRTHRRHHLQQCQYSFCVKEICENVFQFANHEDVFKLNKKNQDLLKKFIIPFEQKNSFLKHLNRMNINSYSLFETEEGLLDKLANEEFKFE